VAIFIFAKEHMSMSLPSLLLRTCLLLGAASAWAEPGKQTLDLECDYLPNVCNQPEDANPGLMIEIGSEAIRRAGFVPNVKIRPWVRPCAKCWPARPPDHLFCAHTGTRSFVQLDRGDQHHGLPVFHPQWRRTMQHPAASHQSRSDRCAGWLKRAAG
jgi:hypothetical protein